MAGLPGRRHGGGRPAPCGLSDASHPGARRGSRRPAAAAPRDGLRQHHPHRRRTRRGRRRGAGAADHRVEPLERGRDGDPRQQVRRRRPHRHLRLGRLAVRDRLQPLLPRQGGRRLRRPAVHPGPRLPRHLRPCLPGRTAQRDAAGQLPPRGRRQRSALVPAPAPAALAVGVPHRLHGPRPDLRDLPGAVQPLSDQPRHQGPEQLPRLGVPRRRRDGRAGVHHRAHPRLPRGPGQPDLRHQLQLAAARRSGARQLQDRAGAGVPLPGRRLERDQDPLGHRLGRAVPPGHHGRPGPPAPRGTGRAGADVPDARRRLHPRGLLRQGPGARRDGEAAERRQDRRVFPVLARRPRGPQGLRRVPGGPRAQGRADGDPGPDSQGPHPR